MSENNEICRQIVYRLLGFTGKHAFSGPAKDWEKFKEPEFQSFIKTHSIEEETRIAVFDHGSDIYAVALI